MTCEFCECSLLVILIFSMRQLKVTVIYFLISVGDQAGIFLEATAFFQCLAIATHISHGHRMPMTVNMHVSTWIVFKKTSSAGSAIKHRTLKKCLKTCSCLSLAPPLPWQPSLSDGHRKPDLRRIGSKTLFLG